MWFHCRDMPSDTPRLLMRRAKSILAQELTALSRLYREAIVRRLRVEAAVMARLSEEDGRAGLVLGGPGAGALELAAQGGGVSNCNEASSSVNTSEALVAAGSSPAASSPGPNGNEKDTTACASLAAASKLRLEREVAKVMRDEPLSAESALTTVGVEGVGGLSGMGGELTQEGLGLEQWDFVTGLVGLNRIASRISDLSDEEKRKMLFGSDQLVP